MLRCVICGSDLGEHDGYVRGSISGEVFELGDAPPKATGQKNAWEGVAYCLQHYLDIPQNIADNINTIAAKRKKDTK